MKTKNKVFIVVIILSGLFCITVAIPSCFNNWSLSSNYSKEVIALPDGDKIYVMLEEWGRNDRRLSLTQNPRGCQPANPDTDYIFNDIMHDMLIYKVTDKELVIFSLDEYWHQPKTAWIKNRPVFEIRESEMISRPEDYGVTVLRNYSSQWCFRNLFRASSSLRPEILRREQEVLQ